MEFREANAFDSFKNWLEDDYYHYLGISQNATLTEIKNAFKIKVKENNPLHYPECSAARYQAENNLKKLLLARDILTNSEKREIYDSERQLYQECYLQFMNTPINNNENIFAKDKKVIRAMPVKPEINIKILEKYVKKESELYKHITQTQIRKVADLYNLCSH